MSEQPERLIIPADLEQEAEDLANKMLAAAGKLARRPPVMVSVGRKSGNVRRNGPCPCGSGLKYKKCCLEKVDDGQLPRIRQGKGGGTRRQPPTTYDPPRRRSKYTRKGVVQPDETHGD